MADVIIRDAFAEDLDAMLVLWKDLERAQGSFRIFPVADDAESIVRDDFAAAVVDPNCRVLIAEAEGAPVGMAIARAQSRAGLSRVHNVELSRVVVADGRRGQGIGPMLIDTAEAFARELGAAYLIARVFSRNEVGLRFWDRVGFESYYEARARRVR